MAALSQRKGQDGMTCERQWARLRFSWPTEAATCPRKGLSPPSHFLTVIDLSCPPADTGLKWERETYVHRRHPRASRAPLQGTSAQRGQAAGKGQVAWPGPGAVPRRRKLWFGKLGRADASCRCAAR